MIKWYGQTGGRIAALLQQFKSQADEYTRNLAQYCSRSSGSQYVTTFPRVSPCATTQYLVTREQGGWYWIRLLQLDRLARACSS